jgi:hypothetical protein
MTDERVTSEPVPAVVGIQMIGATFCSDSNNSGSCFDFQFPFQYVSDKDVMEEKNENDNKDNDGGEKA